MEVQKQEAEVMMPVVVAEDPPQTQAMAEMVLMAQVMWAVLVVSVKEMAAQEAAIQQDQDLRDSRQAAVVEEEVVAIVEPRQVQVQAVRSSYHGWFRYLRN
jgi:hypothetical protein